MRAALGILPGLLAGGFLGYLAGVYAACDVVWPESNLCGLAGVFFTRPLGAAAGGVAGWRLSRRR
jgi:hypothetical protein